MAAADGKGADGAGSGQATGQASYNPADVRPLDLLAGSASAQVLYAKLRELLPLLDVWNLRSFKGQSRRDAAWNVAVRFAPCLNWLASYDVKRQLLPDIAAGVAVSFLIIPQGMSYASVAGLPAVYGLYTDFLPLFIYFWFGSSQYLQVGAVAVVSLLTANTVTKLCASETSAVGALSAAAKAAAAAAKASPSNSTLAALSASSSSSYLTASAGLIQLQVEYASLLAFYAGIFSFFIGFLKLGFVMNLMGPAVISGFQSAVSITIALGQFKNTFGYGKDFTTSTKLDALIQSYIDNRGNLSWTSTWTGWLWIGILVVFKYLGRIDRIRVRGVRVMRFFKIAGPIAVCIIAILSTRYAELYLSPGCRGYDAVKGVSNVYVATSPASAWNISYNKVTTTDFLGRLVTYAPPADNPHCVPMPKSNLAGAAVPYPWPRWRGLQITGEFGGPPTGKKPNFGLVNGEVLTGAIIITLVASLESIAIAKALASKHKQPDLDPSREYLALGLANFFGSFTQTYPISGSFSRTALNDEVGASSPVAVLTVAVLVGIVIKIASVVPLFYYLPQNCLSAIVVVALTNLMDVSHFFWLLKFDRKDALLWLTSFLAVLFQGVELGILIAVCTSLGLVVLETFMAPLPELGALVGAKTRRVWRNLSQYPHAERVPGVSVVRVEAPIIFFNASKVGTRLRSLVYGSDAASAEENAAAADRKTRAVLVDFSNVSYVDSAFLEMFDDLLDSFAQAEVLLAVINPNTNVLHKMTITGLTDRLNRQFGTDAGAHHWVFVTVTDAMDAVRTFEPPITAVKAPPPDVDAQAELTRRSSILKTLATMPTAVERLARTYMRQPAVVTIGAAGKAASEIQQLVVLLRSTDEKAAQLEKWLARHAETQAIVFVNSHKVCDFVAKALERLGKSISILHGGKTQDAREAAIDAFRNKRTSILLATDVAGRGIDVPDVGLVVNYQLPATIEAYTHRIGRTGRAGRKGVAVSLATSDDAGLFFDLRNFLQDSGNAVPPELAAHPASRKKYEKGDKFGRNIET